MDDLVLVYATGDHVESQLIVARLENEGIMPLRKGGGDGPYRAGPDYVFVAREDEHAARAVIDAITSGALALTDEDVMAPAEGETD